MTDIQFFEVGGAVRDGLLGIKTKDVDFTACISQPMPIAQAFATLRQHLLDAGFTIFVEAESFLTIRAKVPQGHPLEKRTKVADFVLARKDGPSSDGRRPDWVKPGTLLDDLARRDFTVNAMARDISGDLIDPFWGQMDLAAKLIRFVGEPEQRISEDGLRVLRALRFTITKGFSLAVSTDTALRSQLAADMLAKVADERIMDELDKMFKVDSLGSLDLLAQFPLIRAVCFSRRVRLMPTMKA